ncbi:HTH-type transcriptional regulator MalT [bioreactor metagenome]|uniref:HTH-type transcriptional regulator MalT n=1 Tax=bioreactor metagenome TaxID=1076179 RepID=A0A644WMA7_9ZZZZ
MGYGKTTAVREYLTKKGTPSLWISFPSSENAVSYFWDNISRSAEKFNSDAGIQLKNLGFPSDALQTSQFFSILDNLSLKEKMTLVLDDFHFVKGTQIGSLLVQIAKRKPRNLFIVIITRDLTYLEFIELFSKGLCQIISQNTIRFTDDEIRDYCAITGCMPSGKDLKKICEYADGWILMVYLILIGLQDGIPVGMNVMIDELVDNALFSVYEEPIRRFLLKLSVLDSFTAQQAVFITGEAGTRELLKMLRRENAFLSYADATGIYKIHNVLLDFLRRRQADSLQLPEICRKTGEWYLLQKDFIRAYEFLYRASETERILSLLNEEGTIANRHVTFKGYIEMFKSASKEEMLFRYPYAYLQYISTLLLSGDSSRIKNGLKLLYDLRLYYKKADSIYSGDKNLVLGEISAVHILASFNSAEKMVVCCQKAIGLLAGNRSRLFTRESEFTFSSPYFLFCYFNEPGKLKDTAEIISAGFPNFSLLSDGCGAGCEYMALSEYLLETGAWEAAELNALKALYLAETKEQTGIRFCAVFVLMRLYILQSRIEEGRELLKKLRTDLGMVNTPVYNVTVELMEGYIYSCLGLADRIPRRLRPNELLPADTPHQSLAFRNIVYGKTVLLSKNYIELEMLTEAFASHDSVYIYSLGLLHIQILNSIAKYHLYGLEEGCASLKKALEMGRSDHIILAFAEYAGNILNMMQSIIEKGQDDTYCNEILNHCEQYTKNIKKNIRNGYSLSGRELEILTLASEGLTRGEIADRLCVSAGTVQTHLHNIYRKLGVGGKAAAIKKALKSKNFD